MGYTAHTILIFGVYLTIQQSKRIYDKHFVNDELPYTKQDTITTEVFYTNRLGKPVYKERNVPTMLSDGTDARIHSMRCSYEAENHVIGIEVADKKYDNINDYMLNVGEKTIENFNKYIQPILDEEVIIEKPSMKIVTQVW